MAAVPFTEDMRHKRILPVRFEFYVRYEGTSEETAFGHRVREVVNTIHLQNFFREVQRVVVRFHNAHHMSIHVVSIVQDREGNIDRPWAEVEFVTRLQAVRISDDMNTIRASLASAIRGALSYMVTHEVDEALWVNGVRYFDPHKNDG